MKKEDRSGGGFFQKIPLSRREVTVWGSVIGALVLLGIVGIALRKKETREEAVRPPVDPYRAAAAKTDPVEFHTQSAYSYEAEGNTGMAIREYRELVKLNPDDITAHGILSSLYFKAHDREKAVEEILEVLRIDPSKWAQREILADTYCGMGDYNRACREYEEVLRYSPDSADVRCKLGRVHQRGGRSMLAQEMFQKAVEAEPKSAEAHRGLEASLRARGDLDGAAREAALAKGLEAEAPEPIKAGQLPPQRPRRSIPLPAATAAP